MHVYGGLSDEGSISISVLDLIFKRKSVRGLWLSTWIAGQSIFKILKTAKKARKYISAGNEITIQKKIPLEEFKSGMEVYLNNMTAGKVLQSWIASHMRNRKPSGHTTVEDHLASMHQFMNAWNPETFIQRAVEVGSDTKAYH